VVKNGGPDAEGEVETNPWSWDEKQGRVLQRRKDEPEFRKKVAARPGRR